MRTYLFIIALGTIAYSCQKRSKEIISKDEAIAEAVKLKLTAKNDISQKIREISENNNHDFDEIDFKSDLGQYFGLKALNKITAPDIKEFSEQIIGIWKLDNRFISGNEVKSNESIVNKLAKDGNYDFIESLTLNKEPSSNSYHKPLASYGVISLQIINGPQKRLPKDTIGILQVFN